MPNSEGAKVQHFLNYTKKYYEKYSNLHRNNFLCSFFANQLVVNAIAVVNRQLLFCFSLNCLARSTAK